MTKSFRIDSQQLLYIINFIGMRWDGGIPAVHANISTVGMLLMAKNFLLPPLGRVRGKVCQFYVISRTVMRRLRSPLLIFDAEGLMSFAQSRSKFIHLVISERL